MRVLAVASCHEVDMESVTESSSSVTFGIPTVNWSPTVGEPVVDGTDFMSGLHTRL